MEGKLAEVTVGSTDVAPYLDQAKPTFFILDRVHFPAVEFDGLIVNFAREAPALWHLIETLIRRARGGLQIAFWLCRVVVIS